MEISSNKIKLVPYLPENVPLYHSWLQDPYIMEMTSTESTTIASEYDNQKSYLTDQSKLIFLVANI